MVTENALIFQVLPVGKELLSCLTCFKELGSCNEGRSALLTSLRHVNTISEELRSESVHERNGNHNHDDFEQKKYPLLCCWKKLMKSIYSKDALSACAVEAVNELSVGSLCFCMDGKRWVNYFELNDSIVKPKNITQDLWVGFLQKKRKEKKIWKH